MDDGHGRETSAGRPPEPQMVEGVEVCRTQEQPPLGDEYGLTFGVYGPLTARWGAGGWGQVAPGVTVLGTGESGHRRVVEG